jgi:hypothetical protein
MDTWIYVIAAAVVLFIAARFVMRRYFPPDTK